MVSDGIVQIISLPGMDGQKPLQVSEGHISNTSAHMRKYFNLYICDSESGEE